MPDLRRTRLLEALRWNGPRRDPRPLHFLHIGKTGGTAIKHALGGVTPETDRYVLRLDGGHAKRLRDVPNGEGVFFFVRDPASRFVSAFYSRQRQGRPRVDRPWTSGEEHAFAIFETANALAEAISSPDAAFSEEAHKAMAAIGHVNTGYRKWLESPRYFLSRRKDIVLVGRQETLGADFERLKGLLGLPDEVVLPQDDVAAHRNPAGVDRNLSAVGKANIEHWYRNDAAYIALLDRRGFLPSAPGGIAEG